MPNVEASPKYQEFRRESVELMSTDPLSAGLSGAYANLMLNKPDFANWIDTISKKRREMGPFSPGHSVRLKRYLAQGALLEMDPKLRIGYPDTETWTNILDEVHETPYYRSEYTTSHMYLNPVTSKPTRYYTMLLMAGLLDEGEQSTFQHVDLGCGPNVGLALENLFMSGRFPLDSKRLPPLPRLSAGSFSERSALRGLFMQARKRKLEKSYGVDIFHPHDPLASKWGGACQLPAALIEPRAKRQRALLTQERDTSMDIKFTHADISAPGLRGKNRTDTRRFYDIEMIPAEFEADFASAFFVHYMLNPESRRVTDDNMAETARYRFVLDAVERVKQRKKGQHPIDQIVFAESWTEWSTALVMHDSENPERGQQLVARFRDGTCQEIRPEGVLLSLFAKAA